MAAVRSPPRTDAPQYSRIKRFLNDVSGTSNSYTFKQALKALRERVEHCEKLTTEIEERYRRGQGV